MHDLGCRNTFCLFTGGAISLAYDVSIGHEICVLSRDLAAGWTDSLVTISKHGSGLSYRVWVVINRAS